MTGQTELLQRHGTSTVNKAPDLLCTNMKKSKNNFGKFFNVLRILKLTIY